MNVVLKIIRSPLADAAVEVRAEVKEAAFMRSIVIDRSIDDVLTMTAHQYARDLAHAMRAGFEFRETILTYGEKASDDVVAVASKRWEEDCVGRLIEDVESPHAILDRMTAQHPQ